MLNRSTRPSAAATESRPLTGIAFKVASVAIFVAMSACLKAAGQLPAGQLVFFRSFFGIFPVLLFLAVRGELAGALTTARPLSHVARGLFGVASMGFGFFALTRLSLPDAITLNYAQPLLVVVFGALFMGERVRLFRSAAVAAGFVGVLIISWPKLELFRRGMGGGETAGVVAALVGAGLSAFAMLLVRSLVHTERSATVVLWFSLTATVVALFSIPFGWSALSATQVALLVSAGFCGGVAQIFLTEGYRYAEASSVAPFEYTSMVLAVAVGYFVFAELPTVHTVIGGSIVIAAGIAIILREHRLGLKREAAKRASPPQ